MRMACALLLAGAFLSRDAIGSAFPHVGCEWAMAYSSFSYPSDRSPYQDRGRWLPRAALVIGFDVPGNARLSTSLEYVERGGTSALEQSLYSEHETLHERHVGLALQVGRPVVPHVWITLGPEVAYRIKGIASGSYSAGPGAPTPYWLDYTRKGSRWDVLGVVGLALTLPGGARLQGRYVYGVTQQERAGHFLGTRATPWQPSSTFPTAESKTRSLEVGLGIGW
jgi:hypothetical protein